MTFLRAASAALTVAIAAAPIVLDRCAGTCQAHHEAVASTPACHHTGSTGMRIASVPAPCGHDHNTTTATVTVTGRSPVNVLLFQPFAAVIPAVALAVTVSSSRLVFETGPHGRALAPPSSALPLRI